MKSKYNKDWKQARKEQQERLRAALVIATHTRSPFAQDKVSQAYNEEKVQEAYQIINQ